MSFPGGSVVKNLPTTSGDTGSIPGWGRSPRAWHGSPRQCSYLGNPRDRGAWQARVHEVAKSRTRLSDSSWNAEEEGASVHGSGCLVQCKLGTRTATSSCTTYILHSFRWCPSLVSLTCPTLEEMLRNKTNSEESGRERQMMTPS